VSEPSPPSPLAEWDRLAELHERARRASPADREGLLDDLRRESPALADELAAMLGATPETAGLDLERRLARTDARTDAPSLATGQRVGPWRLLRFLARGGMGEVYLAERADGAFERQVAVKLLRPGIASADLVERFQLERNLLARLEHPAVVPLLDAGTAADGRPYLALRYVDGRPITRHCDETGASARRRAELFVELCRAVQFAHANLVVHRDLKPSNVLVGADGRVHLLDFGIAKLLSPREDVREPTRTVELAPMTPQRAAPEQRRGEPVTTATDVWALGVLLHELLTGALPAGEGAARPAPAPGRLDRDLAAVVARALAPEPARRYASAGELADEVERWLAGEPVRARPDSLGYRAGRFVGRHRLSVAAATVAALALAALAVVSILRSREANRERARAAREAARSEAVVDLMVDLFGGVDPIAGADVDTVRVADLMALGATKAAALRGQPDVQARLRHVLGRIQLERGAWMPALELLRAARDSVLARLGPDDLQAVPFLLDHARALHSTGDRAGALADAREALGRIERAPKPDPLVHALALADVGAMEGGPEGERRVEGALEVLRSTPGAEPLDVAAVLTNLGFLHKMRGDGVGARSLFAEALAILRTERGETHPHTLSLRSNLVALLPDPRDRVREHREILALRRSKLGDRHYAVANSWSLLGVALGDSGAFDEAAAAHATAHSIWVATDGPGHASSLASLRHRARALDRAGRAAEASAAWERLRADLAGARVHPRTSAAYRVDLALHRLAAGRAAEAEREAATALAEIASASLPSARTRARAEAARGRALLALGRAVEGRALLDSALAVLEDEPPDDPAELAALRAARGSTAPRGNP
jgi:serine/threonine-protein kinase